MMATLTPLSGTKHSLMSGRAFLVKLNFRTNRNPIRGLWKYRVLACELQEPSEWALPAMSVLGDPPWPRAPPGPLCFSLGVWTRARRQGSPLVGGLRLWTLCICEEPYLAGELEEVERSLEKGRGVETYGEGASEGVPLGPRVRETDRRRGCPGPSPGSSPRWGLPGPPSPLGTRAGGLSNMVGRSPCPPRWSRGDSLAALGSLVWKMEAPCAGRCWERPGDVLRTSSCCQGSGTAPPTPGPLRRWAAQSAVCHAGLHFLPVNKTFKQLYFQLRVLSRGRGWSVWQDGHEDSSSSTCHLPSTAVARGCLGPQGHRVCPTAPGQACTLAGSF